MERLHLHDRLIRGTVALGLAVGIGVVGSCSCTDRPLGLEDDLEQREAACMWLIGARGVSGNMRPGLRDYERRVGGTVCLCLTDEELEQQTRHEELNDMALEECRNLAETNPYAPLESDNCDELYESGAWLGDVYRAVGGWENGPPPGFNCG